MQEHKDFVDDVIISLVIMQFQQQLTERQKDVFERCLLGGMNLRNYAKLKRLNYRTVWDVREAIQKKFSEFIKIFW